MVKYKSSADFKTGKLKMTSLGTSATLRTPMCLLLRTSPDTDKESYMNSHVPNEQEKFTPFGQMTAEYSPNSQKVDKNI